MGGIGHSYLCDVDPVVCKEMEGHLDNTMRLCNFIEMYLGKNKMTEIRGKLLWITLRPADGAFTCEEMRVRVFAICGKPYVSQFCWTMEQVGEDHDSLGTGIHFHMLIRFTNRLDVVKRMIGDKFPGAYVYYKNCREIYRDDKILYMLGYKREEKLEKAQMDIIWRERNNLPNPVAISGWTVPAWPTGSVAWGQAPTIANPEDQPYESEEAI